MRSLLIFAGLLAVVALAWLMRHDVLDRIEDESNAHWYLEEIRAAANASSVDVCLIGAMVHVESRFDPEAVSSRGAVGLMQLLPSTARETARRNKLAVPDTDAIMSPGTNILLGALYLRHLMERFGDTDLAVAAYNGGPGDIREWLEGGDSDLETFGKEETKRYVERVRESYNRLKRLREAWRFVKTHV